MAIVYSIHYGTHLEPTDTVKNYLDGKVARLDKYVADAPADGVILRMDIDKVPGKDLYQCGFRFTVRGRQFVAKDEGHGWQAAMDNALDALEAELDKDKGRREDSHHHLSHA